MRFGNFTLLELHQQSGEVERLSVATKRRTSRDTRPTTHGRAGEDLSRQLLHHASLLRRQFDETSREEIPFCATVASLPGFLKTRNLRFDESPAGSIHQHYYITNRSDCDETHLLHALIVVVHCWWAKSNLSGRANRARTEHPTCLSWTTASRCDVYSYAGLPYGSEDNNDATVDNTHEHSTTDSRKGETKYKQGAEITVS